MIEVLVKEEYQDQVDKDRLLLAALAVLAQQEQPHDSEISIRITDDEEVKRLNQQYRRLDQSTDVLSFTSDEINPETGQRYLGDICISLPTVQRQSQKFGHSITDELQLLVVHGCLHLLGFDHLDTAEKEKMWLAQAEVLETLGVKINADDLS